MKNKVARLGRALIVIVFVCAPMSGAQKSPKPATQQEESYMFGRILGAVEDTGGGYRREAIGKLASINKDLEKRQYAARTRWLAHSSYGKALLEAGKPDDAVRLLEIAQKEAESLAEKERKETAELLRQAKAKVQ
jgi:hypothetical protein